ncbi:MAG: hypothetical protein ACYDGR_07840 [Candidatus Dormibacteria bacterium]
MNQNLFKLGHRCALGLAGTLALLAPTTLPASAAEAMPGSLLWTHPGGQATYDHYGSQIECGDPKCSQTDMELRQGSMELSDDRKTLKVRLMVTNLQHLTPSSGAPSDGRTHMWSMTWQYQAVNYFASAVEGYDVSAQKMALEFIDGADATVGYTRCSYTHVDTGTFTVGPNGLIEIDVPLANVGVSVPSGRLTYVAANSQDIVGIYAFPSATASPLTCDLTGTEAPADSVIQDKDFDLHSGSAVDSGGSAASQPAGDSAGLRQSMADPPVSTIAPAVVTGGLQAGATGRHVRPNQEREL